MKRALATLLLIAVSVSANAQNRPNVVLMLGDNVGYGDIGATAITAGKWHLGASEQSWPVRQGFDEYRVGVLETTDNTLYREAILRSAILRSRRPP